MATLSSASGFAGRRNGDVSLTCAGKPSRVSRLLFGSRSSRGMRNAPPRASARTASCPPRGYRASPRSPPPSTLAVVVAAVDVNELADHVARLVGGEEHDDVGD